MEFGLNLYSIRNHLQTEKDTVDALLKLKEMGYSFVQFSGCPLGADAIRRVSKEAEMPIVLTHMPFDRITKEVFLAYGFIKKRDAFVGRSYLSR